MRIASLVLPNQDNQGRDLRTVHAALRGELITQFGGYTGCPMTGGWRADDGTDYAESGTLYLVAMEPTQANRNALADIASEYAGRARQMCVMVAHAEGDVEFVEPVRAPWAALTDAAD